MFSSAQVEEVARRSGATLEKAERTSNLCSRLLDRVLFHNRNNENVSILDGDHYIATVMCVSIGSRGRVTGSRSVHSKPVTQTNVNEFSSVQVGFYLNKGNIQPKCFSFGLFFGFIG